MPKLWTVYALSDPRTDQVRYVGCTSQRLDIRVRAHYYLAAYDKTSHEKNEWLLELGSVGLAPRAMVLEYTSSDWEAAESRWIEKFRTDGCDLLNMTSGGMGLRGYEHTSETRKKMAESSTGCRHSPETISKMIELGKERNPRVADRIAATLRGRTLSAEHKKRISDGVKRRHWTPSAEHRAIMSTTHKGKIISSDHRLSQSRKMRNKEHPKNPSGTPYIGIGLSGRKWKAEYTVNGKKIYVGTFETPEQAARARDRAVFEIYGFDVLLNFPGEMDRLL